MKTHGRRTSSSPRRTRKHMLALEPRILFDGAPLTDLAAPPQEPAPVPNPLELVVVDSGVNGWETLVQGVRPEAQILVLNGASNGIAQVSEKLQSLGQVSALHILSHGSPGAVSIGDTSVDIASLDSNPTLGAALAAWRDHLTPGADILLYGCNVAAGDTGPTLLQRLSSITGADLAASTDDTGLATSGGDWTLEATTGAIEAGIALTPEAQAAYDNLLAVPGAHSAKVGSEVFLGGNYIELGISAVGSFGTSGSKPSGFVGTSNTTRIGMTGDADGFGTGTNLAIDYFLPGTPEERWAVGYNGNISGGFSALAGNVGAALTGTSVTNLSSGTNLAARFVGTVGSTLQVQQDMTFGVNDLFFKNAVTLTNTSGSTLTAVRFMRSFDPDNTVYKNTSAVNAYRTINTVQNTFAAGDGVAVVAATSQLNDTYYTLAGNKQATILYYSSDSRARVSTFGFKNSDPYAAAAYNSASAKGYTVTADQAITIAFDVGSLAPGASATVTYYTSLDNRPIGTIISSIAAADSKTLAAINEDAGSTAGQTVASGFGGAAAITSVNNTNGYWQYQASGGSWTDFSATRGSNVDLGASARLLGSTYSVRFVPNADWNGSSSLSYKTWDGGTYSAGGTNAATDAHFSSGAANASLTVNPVNDAPVLTSGTTVNLAGIIEDASSNAGTAVSSLLTNISDVDTGAVKGIAITGLTNTTNGTWQYTTNGSTWVALNSASDASALLLRGDDANTKIRFAPNANWNGNATFSYRAWDQTSGSNGATANVATNGATTAFSTNAGTASIAVTAVNDTPSFIKGANQAANEDAGLQTVSGWATALSKGPSDETAQALDFIVTNNNNGLFSVQPAIDTNGNLTYTSTANLSGTATVTVQIHDNGGTANSGVDTSAAQTFTITVNPVNDAPVISNNPALGAVLEDAATPSGASIASLVSITDADPGATLGGIAVTANAADSAHGAWQYSSDGGVNWYAVNPGSGSLGDGTSALALSASSKLRFLPAANYSGTPGALTLRALDNTYSGSYTVGASRALLNTTTYGGITPVSAESTLKTLTTSVTAVNDAPTLTTVDTLAGASEDAAYTITYAALLAAANEGDVDVADTMRFRIEALSNGTLTKSGIPISAGTTTLGSGEELVWTPVANTNGTLDAFTIKAIDTANATSAAPVQVKVTVAAVNDAPTLSGNASLGAINEGAAPVGATVTALIGGLFGDSTDTQTGGSSANTLAGIAVVGNAATEAQGTWKYSADGANWHAIGNVADNGTALVLDTSAKLAFFPATDFNGTPGALSFRAIDSSYSGSFTASTASEARVTVNASSNGGITAVSATPRTLNTSITAVNDAPVASGAATLASSNEDATPSNATVATLFDARFNDSTDTQTGNAASGGSSANTLAGIAVVGNTTATSQGIWQWSTDGTNWNNIGGVSNSLARTLKSTDYLRFLPAADYNGTPTGLSVRLIDSSTTVTSGATLDVSSNGAATPYSTATVALGTTVAAVDDAPVIALSRSAVNYTENASGFVVDGSLTLTDADGGTVTGATVSIGTGFQTGEDVLAMATIGSISASYNATTGILTLSGSGTAAEYQAALRTVTYSNSSENPTAAARTLSIDLTNSGGADTVAKTLTLTPQRVNDQPLLGGTAGSPTLAYAEPAGLGSASTLVAIDSGFTVTDPDNTTLNGGFLRIQITSNGLAEDVLGVIHSGSGAGQIGVSGATVSYAGTTIGTIDGTDDGSSGKALKIALNSAATPTVVQALSRAIGYRNTSDTPSIATRTVSFTVDDGGNTGTGGALQGTRTTSIGVTALSDAPTQGVHAATVAEGQSVTLTSSMLQATDVDNTPSQITYTLATTPTGGILYKNGVALAADGTFTQADIDAGRINYTHGGAEAVSDSFTFHVSDGTTRVPAGTAETTFDLTVTAFNDAPTIALPSSSQLMTQNSFVTVGTSTHVQVADVDASASLVKVTLSATQGTALLKLTTTGLTFADAGKDTNGGAGRQVLEFTGTLTDVNNALNTLQYKNSATYETSGGADTLTITISDQGNTGAGGAKSATTRLSLVTVLAGGIPAGYDGAEAVLEDTVLHGDLGADGTYSIVSSVANGGLTLDTTTGAYDYTPTLNYSGVDQFTYNGGAGDKLVKIYVVPVNDAPVMATAAGNPAAFAEPASGTATIDDGRVIDSILTLTDVDGTVNDHISSATVKIATGQVSGDTLGVPSSVTATLFDAAWDSAAGTLTLTAKSGQSPTITEFRDALRQVAFYSTSDNPTNGTRSIRFEAWDQDGASSGTVTHTLAVAPVNDAPTIGDSVNALRNATEDTSLAITGLSISDADASSATMRLTLSVTHGTLRLDGTDGLTIAAGANGSGSITVDGSRDAINTALSGLTYMPAANYNGNDTLSIGIDDNGNDGSGGSKTASGTVSINVAAVNDVAVLGGDPAVLNFIEPIDAAGTTTAYAIDPGITIGDVDNPNLNGGYLQVALTSNGQATDQLSVVPGGSITVSSDGTTTTISNSGTAIGSYTNSDTNANGINGNPLKISLNTNATPAAVQALARAIGYRSSSDNPSTAIRTATFTVNDGSDSATRNDLIAVTPTNDAPVASNFSQALAAGLGAQTFSWKDGTHANASDPEGDTVTAVLKTPAGKGQVVISGDNYIYTPIPGSAGTDTFVITLSDGNGGTKDVTVSITGIDTVTPVLRSTGPADDATGMASDTNIVLRFDRAMSAGSVGSIVLYKSDNSIVETFAFNSSRISFDGSVVTIDPANLLLDNTSYYIQYASTALASVADTDHGIASGSPVAIDDTTSFNFTTGTFSPTRGAGSGFDLTDQTPVRLDNTVTSNTVTVAGMSGPAPIWITDNGNGSGFEYRINGGTWTSAPGSVQNGDTVTVRLTTANAINTASTLTVHIGGSFTETFTATTRSNAAPTLPVATQTFNEDAVPPVVNLAAADTDSITYAGDGSATTDTLTYSLVNAGNSSTILATLNGSQITLTPAANYNGTQSITVRVSDGITSTDTAFNATANPVNDSPVFTKGLDVTVLGTSGAQTRSAWATGIGKGGVGDEAGQVLTFSVVGNTDATIFTSAPAIDTVTGHLTFTPANKNGTATVTVRLSDDGGTANGGVNSVDQTFTITVVKVNEAPTLTADTAANNATTTGTTTTWTEAGPNSSTANTAVLVAPNVTLSADDFTPNYKGATLTVSLSGSHAEDQLSIRDEGAGSNTIRLSGGAGGSSGGAVTYNGNNIGTYASTDGGRTLTISFTDGAAIPVTAGNVTTAAVQALMRNITYFNSSQTPNTADRTVTFSFNDGGGADNSANPVGTVAYTVTVNSTNDAPTNIVLGTSAAADAASFGTTVVAPGNSLVNGLGSPTGATGSIGFGERVVTVGDDGYDTVDVSSVFTHGFNYFGTTYNAANKFFVGWNGYVTFGQGSYSYTPAGISQSTVPIIAPMYLDFDTRGGSTSADPSVVRTADPNALLSGNSKGTNRIYVDQDTASKTVTITYDDVGEYSRRTDRANAYQIILIDKSVDGVTSTYGNFDIEFRYESIGWANHGSWTSAGWSAGDRTNYSEITGSMTSAMAGLAGLSNIDHPGAFLWQVRGGAVSNAGITVNENAPNDTVVSPLATADVDGANIAYAFVTDAGGGTLSSNSGGLTDPAGRFKLVNNAGDWNLSVADTALLNYEAATSHTVYVKATDAGGLSVVKTFTIPVNNLNEAPTASTAYNGSTNEDTTLSGSLVSLVADVDANDKTGGNFNGTFSVVGAPSHGRLVLNASGSFTYTPDANWNGSDSFTWKATDRGGLDTGTKTATITVNPVNDGPVAARAVVDQTYAATPENGGVWSYTVPANTFTDVDTGDTLTWSATQPDGSALPGWLSFNPATRTFSGVPPNGVFAVGLKLNVMDSGNLTASTTFQLLIPDGAANVAPEVAIAIPDQAWTGSGSHAYQIPVGSFIDRNGDQLSFGAKLADGRALPGWLRFDPDSRTFAGNPPTFNGSIELRVTVTDPLGVTATDDFTIRWTDANDAPVVANSIPLTSFTGAGNWRYQIPANTFADPDIGDLMTLSATLADGSSLPAWMSFDPVTRSFTGNPPGGEPNREILITATDATGESASTLLRANFSATNDTPSLDHPAQDQLYGGAGNWSYSIPAGAFSDADIEPVMTRATLANGDPLPDWLSFNPATGTFSGLPPGYNNGDGDASVHSIALKVTASDDAGASASTTFSLGVPSGVNNYDPTLDIADQTYAGAGAWVFQTPPAVDRDGNALTYTATLSDGAALPSWLGFDAATHTFNGNPPAGMSSLALKVVANDGSRTGFDTFTVTFSSTNDAPVLANPIPNRTFDGPGTHTFAIPGGTFTDGDGDTLSYVPTPTLADGSPLPSWLTFDATTRTFSGNPPADGALDILVTARDPSGATVTSSFTLTMVNTDDAPSLSGNAANQFVTDKTTLTPFSSVVITDADLGQQVTVIIRNDGTAKGSFTNASGFTRGGGGVYRFTGTPVEAQAAIRGMVYTPADNRVEPEQFETTTFTIDVADDAGANTEVTASARSLAIDDKPVTMADSGTLLQDTSLVVDVLINDGDDDLNDDGITVVGVTQGSFGRVTITADNKILYVPEPGKYGIETFTYTAEDKHPAATIAANSLHRNRTIETVTLDVKFVPKMTASAPVAKPEPPPPPPVKLADAVANPVALAAGAQSTGGTQNGSLNAGGNPVAQAAGAPSARSLDAGGNPVAQAASAPSASGSGAPGSSSSTPPSPMLAVPGGFDTGRTSSPGLGAAPPMPTTGLPPLPAASAPVPVGAAPAGPAVPNVPEAGFRVQTARTADPAPTAAGAAAVPGAIGDRLFVMRGVTDQVFAVGRPVDVRVAPDAFGHTKTDAIVELQATQASGAPLPAWMNFDPLTGMFSGQPPTGARGVLAVRVIARDTDGREAVTTFRISVGSDVPQQPAAPVPAAPQEAPQQAVEPRTDAGDADELDPPAKLVKVAQRNEQPVKRTYASFSEQLKRARVARDPLLARMAQIKAHESVPARLS